MSSCHSVPASFNVFYAIQYLRSYSLESSESPGILILTTDHALTEWLWDETSAGEYPRPRLPKEISKPWTMPQVQTRILCRYIPDYAKTFCGFETFLFTLQLPPSTKVFAESDAESVDIIDGRFQHFLTKNEEGLCAREIPDIFYFLVIALCPGIWSTCGTYAKIFRLYCYWIFFFKQSLTIWRCREKIGEAR